MINSKFPDLKYADFGTMGKNSFKRVSSALNFKDHIAQNSGFLNNKRADKPHVSMAQQFYKSINKRNKMQTQMHKNKTQNLEREEWGDNAVFTGDSIGFQQALAN